LSELLAIADSGRVTGVKPEETEEDFPKANPGEALSKETRAIMDR
jgi:hypothetical protein